MKQRMSDALEDLYNGGKAMFRVSDAVELAKIFGATCYAELIYVWLDSDDAFRRFEIFPSKEGPGMGINGGELLTSILTQVMQQRGINLDAMPGRKYIGRGPTARANAQYLRELMEAEFGVEVEPDSPSVDITVDVTE